MKVNRIKPFDVIKDKEFPMKIRVIKFKLFEFRFQLSFTMKYPSFDFEIHDNELNRLYELAWFQKDLMNI